MGDDPTDEELALEGLTRGSYALLDIKSRKKVNEKIVFYRGLLCQNIAAQLLNEMSSELGDKRIIVEVLEGKNQLGAEAIREIIEDYSRSGIPTVKEYYRLRHSGKAQEILSGKV